MKKKVSATRNTVENKPSSAAQSRKKAPDMWQDMVKFQQELMNMQTLEEDQDMRLMRLECILKRFQKNIAAEETGKFELNRTARYYVNQLAKLDVEAKRLKTSSEKKIQMLQDLKKESDLYLNSVKEEQMRHYTTMMTLNADMMKNLEKLKKIASEEFQDLEAILRPSSRWIFFTKSKRSLTPSADAKLDSDMKNDSFSSVDRPRTQYEERQRPDQQERPRTALSKKNGSDQQESLTPSEKESEFIFGTHLDNIP